MESGKTRTPLAIAIAAALGAGGLAGSQSLQPVEAASGGEWGLCPAFGPERPAYQPLAEGEPGKASADRAEYGTDGTVTLIGDAIVDEPGRRVRGERLIYRQGSEASVSAEGNLWLQTGDMAVQAERGELNLDTDAGRLERAHYWLESQHLSGVAETIVQDDRQHYRLGQATFSTCPAEKRDWEFQAREVNLNRETGRGEAWHTTLRAGGVPVFYAPYLNFPIDDRRQSGLLYPTFGNSTEGGFEYAQPYYWNIAPNLDATLTPTLLTKRGLGLGGQVRWLHQFGSEDLGRDQLDFFYLPDDRVEGGSRWSLGLDSSGRVNPDLDYRVDINRVSDDQFFQDFSTNLEQSTTSHLRSDVRLNARPGGGWNLGLLAQRYQTINPDLSEYQYPYRIMPRLTASNRFGLGQWGEHVAPSLSVRADVTRFAHPSSERIVGDRAHAAIGLGQTFDDTWYRLRPQVTLDTTSYHLDDADPNTIDGNRAFDTSATRSVPISSIDGSLFFERAYGETGRYRALLEPRLYYLYVPYRDQSDIPLFDTGQPTLSYSQLFRPNRYSGGDRIADENALTYGLSWSLIDTQQGTVPLSLRVAQRYRFEDSETVLPPNFATPETHPSYREAGGSTVLAEVYSDVTQNWNGSFTAEYDTDRERVSRSQTRLGYRGEDNRVLNFSWFTREGINESDRDYRQGDVSFAWPLSRRWSMLGRVGYDFESEQVVQSLLGVGYESCCWSARLAFKRYIVRPDVGTDLGDDAEYSNAVVFQVELKGLGGIGGNQFRDDILGFDP
ncbi:LPS-assembly protein LptD [Guyparkeria hydrothermalis]|uniref:LPS-assembly protein LptD n=1 Tax=Guyparkeria hydrothermalis TaxID=923 RepID=UPI0020219E79|nr:LPS-assembly protein LptD [Guyparkeria hydrothermalis]MCL7751931.1 LPS-assembly protein LptD [Guyparkeria hydrothermalis]